MIDWTTTGAIQPPGRGGVLTGVDQAQRDRRFFMGLVLAIALTNFVGFGRTYYLRLVFGEPTGIFGQYLSPLNHFTACSLRPSSSFWSCRRGSRSRQDADPSGSWRVPPA